MLGWVKLHRKSLDSGLLQNHKLWAFWSWCLIKAAHKQHKQMVGFEVVELQPGQFIFGRKKAASELNMSEQSVRTCLNRLKKLKNLTTSSTNKYTIINIEKWATYQQDDSASSQQDNHQVTSTQPAPNHKQECKNVNNEKEDIVEPNSLDPISPPENPKKKKPEKMPYKEIVSYLNEKTGCDYKPTAKETQRCIKARWNAGFRLDDFKNVIDHKVDEWSTDEEFCQYLRPQTLFGTKFEGYLQAAKKNPYACAPGMNRTPEQEKASDEHMKWLKEQGMVQ